MKGVTREGALIPSLWGHPLYEYLSNLSPEPLPSESTKSSEASDVGREVGDHDPSRAAPECGQASPAEPTPGGAIRGSKHRRARPCSPLSDSGLISGSTP